MFKISGLNTIKQKICKRNIPEYLYHMTGVNTCKNIRQDGFILPSQDRILNKDAIFTIEKKNYLTEWAKTIVDNDNLKNMLLSHINCEKEAVVLKIPTKNLQLRKLFVRNQKKFFKFKNGEYDELPKNPLKMLKSIFDCLHLRYGTPAFLAKFHNKPKAYEYIYKDKIDIKDIDEIIPLDEFLKSY